MPSIGGFSSGAVASLGGVGTRVGVAFVQLTTDNTGLVQGFRQADAATQAWARRYGTTVGSTLYQTSRKMSQIGSSLTKSVTLPLVAAGGAAALYASKFQTAMAKTVALANVSADSVGAVSERIKELAVATGRDPLELADSLYFLASAGLKAKEVMDALTATAKGAAAGLGTADVIGRTLIAALNAYRGTGITTTKIMDTLTQATREGNVETFELATTIGAVIPLAAQLGVGFDQAASAIAAATNVGVEAHRAVTGLRYLLVNMERPTDKAKETMANYGMSIGMLQKMLADPNKGLVPTLEFMANAFDLTTVKGREAWQTVIGGVRGAILANALIGKNLERTKKVVESVGNAYDDTRSQAQDAFNVMKQTPEFKFNVALSQLKVAAIDLGSKLLPFITEFIGKIGDLAEAFSKLPGPVQDTVIQLAALAAALGPLLWMVGTLGKIAAPIIARVAAGVEATSAASVAAQVAASGRTFSAPAGGVMMGTQYFRAGQLMPVGAQLTSTGAPLASGAMSVGTAEMGIGAFATFLNTPIIKLGVFGAAIAASYKAYKDLSHLLQNRDLANGLVTSVERGSESLDQMNQRFQETQSSIPIFGRIVNAVNALQVHAAAEEIIRDYNRITRSVLTSDSAIRDWGGMLGSTASAATLDTRRDVGNLLQALDDLGLKFTDFQKLNLESLFGANMPKTMLRAISTYITRPELLGSLKDYNGILDDETLAQIRAAEAAHHHYRAVMLLIGAQADAAKNTEKVLAAQDAAARAAAGIAPGSLESKTQYPFSDVPYGTISAIDPNAPFTDENGNVIGYATPTGEVQRYEKLRTALATTPGSTLSTQASTETGTRLAQFYASGGTMTNKQAERFAKAIHEGNIKDFNAFLERFIVANKASSPLYEQSVDKLLKTPAMANLRTQLAGTNLATMFSDFGATTGQGFGGMPTGAIAQIGGQLSRLQQEFPGVFSGKTGQKRELAIQIAVSEGNSKKALNLIQQYYRDSPLNVTVNANTDPANQDVISWANHLSATIRVMAKWETNPGGPQHDQGPHPHRGQGGLGSGPPPPRHGGRTRHFGGWTHGGTVDTDVGEMFIRRDEAARNARVLNRINAGMGHSDPELRRLRQDLSQVHTILLSQQREIAQMVGAGAVGSTGTHGDVMLDGFKVGRVLEGRRRRGARQ